MTTLLTLIMYFCSHHFQAPIEVDSGIYTATVSSHNMEWFGDAPDHQLFDDLLSKYVDEKGRVDYKSFKADVPKLEIYLSELSASFPSSQWSSNEKLAYWINAYNAYTIKLILDHYPVNSITEIEGGKPWDKKWIKLGTKVYSLNEIENEVIRVQFKEPRIHFAVNCAAKSCPPLANKAYTANNLDMMLQERTKTFINNPDYNQIQPSKISISKIFDWYQSDFKDVISFLNNYSSSKINSSANISYLEYDWALNKQ